MAAGRKAPPWRRGKDGAPTSRNRRRQHHSAKSQQILFAASPLLLLLIGCLSSLSFSLVAVEATAGVQEEAGRALGGGSFGRWMSSGDDESFASDNTGGQKKAQRRRLQTSFDVELSDSIVSVAEGGAEATYTVVLSTDPGTTVNINIATASSEITLSESQLVFPGSDGGTAQPVTVSAVDDGEVESLEDVIITHSVDIPDGSVWDGVFSPSSATITARVYDDDEAGILVSSSTLYIDEAGSTTYDVKLMGSPSQDVEVTATASNGLISVTPSSRIFTSVTWDSSQTFTVDGVDDSVETAESYTATVSHAASSTDALFDGTAPFYFPSSEISVVIYDNDNGCYRDCAAGTWASPCNGSYECASCNPGYYCAGDCVDPVACPAGTSLEEFGASVLGDCEDCPDGYYASEQGSASCSPCPAGYSCSSADAAPEACSAGEYASAGALSCSECADGYYNALEAQEFCQACPAGYECPDKASVPTRCSSGSYSYGNSTLCESCPAGYYCSSTGSSPEVCTEGSYSLDNWAYCVACPPGAFCINTAQEPSACPAGTASLGGSTTCTACASGTYSSVNGSDECTNCPAGSSCLDVSGEPQACANGTFSQLGDAICSDCAAGLYSGERASSCLSCPVGHFCFNPASSPTLCGEGYFSTGGLVPSCSACVPGTYTDDLHDRCIACSAGHSCSDPFIGEIECAEGTFSTGGSVSCTECPAGSFCTSPFTAAEACGAGTYSTIGSANCTVCPGGSYCATPSELPIGCSDGYYSPAGETSCFVCPAGSYCPGPPRDEESKAACAPGTYSESGSSSCSECPKGFYCPDAAQAPEACPNGYYSHMGNMTECDMCTAGHYCPSAAMPEQPCPEGYYSGNAAVNCTACPPGAACPTAAIGFVSCSPGTFSVGLANNCTSCPPGYYCPNTEAAEFYQCPDGTYSTGDASSCEVCSPGFYCPLTTVAAELPCPDGYYSTGAASNCTACDPGFTCTADGSSLIACTPGSYSPAGSMSCVTCPAGSYCPNTSSDTVLPCSPGTYSIGAAYSCTECQAGYYCPNIDNDQDLPCLSGTFAVGGKHVCTDCPAGFTCSSTSTAQMEACGVGYYSLLGEPLCTPCPAGYRCPLASDSPISCDPGYYSTAASTNCTSCPAGYFCDDPEATPQPCEVGSYSGGGTAICLDCQPGYRCPEASVGATPAGSECPIGTYCNPARTLLQCPAGTYGNATAAASLEEGCQACTEGYYCTDTGNTLATRKLCPAGYYCPVGSLSPSSCPAGQYNPNNGSWSSNDCTACSAGYYCTSGSTSATSHPCPAGRYCLASTPSANFYLCPAGTYSGSTGLTVSSQCLTCTIGNYCPAGSTSPTNCLPGTYQPSEGATDASACQDCEPGWACESAAMTGMTTLCDPGHYCPKGTEYADQYDCPAGTYTDSTNLTSAIQCSDCPERKACLAASTSNDWAPCGAGYYCPAKTPTTTSYPCLGGSYTNRTDLAAASECYPCPLGQWCGGSGSDTPDGPCEAGYYCPLRTAAATDYPCPAGTFSNSTSLYTEVQCEDCPPGYFCPEASTDIEPCPAGTYSPYNATEDAGPSSWPSCTVCPAGSYCVEASVTPVPCGVGLYSSSGSDACSVCEAGYYCASNETSAVDMITGGGGWSNFSGSSGMCFNGTYCAAGMTRAPDLTSDACPPGHYCPAGVTSPYACPAGTYNPHTGRDDLEEDCLTSPAGYYTVEASTNMTGPCAAGFYCPAGSTGPQQVPCPERYYRNHTTAGSQDDCAYCVSGGYCPSGSTEPLECPRGYYCVHGVSEPEPCPLGTYGNTTGLRKITDCKDCDPGQYCDQRGLTSPAGLCDPGYYCLEGSYTSAPNAPGSPLSIEDTGIGGLCPAGGYCPIGSSYQQPCPHGTYNNFSGAADPADCSACPPGFYCSGTSNPAPTGVCYAGHYCTGGASTPTQNRTQWGYYAPVGSAVQYPCEPGTYNEQEAQESCLACPAGYYCPNQATITQLQCPVASYCPEGTSVPQLCPSGTFSNQLALQAESQCNNCTQGMYCAYNELTEPTGFCEAGYYCSYGAILSNPIDQYYGDECTAGHYCEEGSPWPEACPTGTYYGGRRNDGDHWANNTITGIPYRTYCTLCPASYACNSTGLTAPDFDCGAGYFCKLGASDPMPYCEAGEGLCTYGVCPAGHFCPAGTSDPEVCPPGTYMNNTGAAECFDCPERHYCDGSFPRGYEECPVGHYCDTGTDVPTNCPAGTFSAQAGLALASECTPCTAGSYCAETGRTTVEGPCAEGYYCPSGSEDALGKVGEVTSHVCPQGNFCPAGSAYPEPCPVGTYNPSEQMVAEEDCTACSEGYYCETTELISPTGPCNSGHYCKRGVDTAAPTNGITEVSGVEQGGDLCPIGTYCSSGTATPISCLAGTYNDLEGQGSCFLCQAGYYCLAGATTYENTPCPAGYFCPEGTAFATEYPCPEGTYANTTMTSSEDNCIDAPAGWYVSGAANQGVTGRCDEGFYCSGGSSSATPSCVETVEGICDTGGPCIAGQYCPVGSPMWQACPGGSYCADGSGNVTGSCNEGYYCTQGAKVPSPQNAVDEYGNFVGDVCPAGYYCPVGSVSPSACPSGTFSGSFGNTNSSACLPCLPGFICPDASTTNCTEPCPAGFYCPAGTIEATNRCGVGEACPASSSEPVDCAPGTYQNEPGQESCMTCLEGYFCLQGTETPDDCPRGSYCPSGTEWGTQYLCPNGTFGAETNLVNITACSTCSPGWYCETAGLDEPTGECDAGYYCGGGATVANPDSMSAVGYQGDTCVDRSNGTTNDLCPPGHYCPQGSGSPIPCPAGTSSSSFNLASDDQCPDCQPGFYCPDVGTYNATVECTEGYYCPRRVAFPTLVCPAGHYCPSGSSSPRECVAGTYQNDTTSADCDICPDRHYCETTATEALACPRGFYCPEGTEFPTQFPCPNGTYSNETMLAAPLECSLCPPGRFCGSEGLNEPEGLCGAGHYCALGSSSPVPPNDTDPTVGGLCSAGYACVEGAESPQPVDGVTGYECPRGTYCPAGSSFPLGCPPGEYNPSEAMEECTDCLAGSICPGNTTTPEECPEFHYCPAGSAAGITCPTGTYGSRTDLEAETECSPCPPGQYCLDGSITSTCRAGYFCKTGIGSPTPNSEYANMTYEDYNEVWEALDAGPCPAGHYCPSGTEDPVQCANASVRASLLGVSADDCGICQAGFVCFPGEPIPEQCPRGYYCPTGEDPIPCPIGSYNPLLQQDDQADCVSCPPGSYCYTEGIGDYTQYPCPAGFFCLERESDPEECPAGTYRNSTGATFVGDCHMCPGGFQCATESVTPDSCPEATFCPPGSSTTTTCPAGSYCPIETPDPIVCPRGYYCPLGSSEPVACVLGTYCPEGSEIFTSCPLGWYGSLTSNNTLWSRDDACDECPPGTYGADPDRLVCETCPGGYVCIGTTTTATPTSIEEHGGFECTPGHYCPAGSWEQIACAAGSYNPETGSSAASACLVCPADHYQDQDGSSTCLPCSSSSTSEANATECRCLGLNRAFQLSDGQCICRSGYEYYNEGGVLVSTVDGAVDCQPIVYERCYTGEALDADGICVSESDCDASCGGLGGTFYEHIGLCECHGKQDLNALCDATCRDNAELMFVDPITGLIVIIDGNSTDYVDPADLPSFTGALYCLDDAGCGLFPVTVSSNFSGVYGTGNAVATATTMSSAASSSSPPGSSRTRRTLTTATSFPREHEDGTGGESFAGPGDSSEDDDDQVVRVRKNGGDVAYSEQDMVETFLHRREGNYRPRNQYRDRFFTDNGTHTTIPGAIPKAQRTYNAGLQPSSTESRGPSTLKSGGDEGTHVRRQRQQEYMQHPEHDDDVDSDDGVDSYGWLPWEQGHPTSILQEDGQAARKMAESMRNRNTRNLQDADVDVEPAVESPLSCISAGDSVLFDISSGCYPVYEKDSLLNSNLEFDYGEFRTIAEVATSSARYETFGFVFEDAGTYVFSSSCDSTSLIVLAVMGEDVSCTTDSHFVPLTAANLIMLGVAKNSDDITLTPDWALIGGLLAGVAFMTFGVVAAVFYFRTKAWTTGQAAVPTYRAKAQARHLEGVDEPFRQRPGFFAKRQNQVSPVDPKPGSGPQGGRTLRSRLSISARSGGFAGSRGEDIEMQSDNGDTFDAEANPDVRELVERMQKYHDEVEKEFTGQKDLVMKLHHLLQQEADELKRLLGAKAGAVGDHPATAVEKSTRATLARLKTDLVSRRLHEAGVSTSEVEALSALKRLQELLQEGAEPFAKRVMQEVANPDIAGKTSVHEGSSASTPLLREIEEGAELIRVEVVNELGESLERERQREHAARTVLEGAVSRGGVVLPEDIVRTLKTMSEMDARTDAGERGVAATMKRLADRLPACTQELCASEGLILRNLSRIRAMGNTSLETAEKQRGEHAISLVLEQLIQALAVVGAKAETEKAAVDTVRIDAEVERRHLETAIDESIKALTIAGSADGAPPPTSDDLQGMLKEIRTLVTSSGSTSAANAAVVAPTRRASALFSQVAENEYRRHSIPYGDAVDNSLLEEEEAEEEARRCEVETNLLAEQEAGVATVSAVTEGQKKSLEEQLEHAGATAEEKQAMMSALADDQKAIEEILEGERIRVAESFRSAAAARKARDEKHAEEDAIEDNQTKAELLHQQNVQMKELRRKHEAAQLAVVGAADSELEAEEQEREGTGDGSGAEVDKDDKSGVVAALRKAHAEQTAMLEASLAAKAKSARHALQDRLAAQRAKREGELVAEGASASEAAMKADKELAANEDSQQEKLAARLAAEKKEALKADASAQRQVRDEVRAAIEENEDPAAAKSATEEEARRIREQAVEAIQELEDAMAEEGKVRRKALTERLKAKRHAKEAELDRRGGGERERCDQDADITRLEELEIEALEERLLNERENRLKGVRASTAAAEVAMTVARGRAAGGSEMDPQAAITCSKMKELHLAAMEKLERDLSRNEKNAARALRDRLQAAREDREAMLQDNESLSASEAAREARSEMEENVGIQKAQDDLMEELANERLEAIKQANLEAEAAGAASIREEADRLVAEHRERMAELQEGMEEDAKRQKSSLQRRLATRRQATDAVVAAAQPVSQQAAAKAASLADLAEEAERSALEQGLLDETTRMQSEADDYERSVRSILATAEEAASGAAATASGAVGAPSVGVEAVVAAVLAAAEETKESLRDVHERAITAMEAQNESKRRVAASRLAQRRAAARATREESLRAAGKSEEDIVRDLSAGDARDAKEAAEEDARLQAAGVVDIEQERDTQMAAVADGVDPKKEAARMRERHMRSIAELDKELEQHCRDQRAALTGRLRKKKAVKEEALRRAGAGEEETAAAMEAFDFEADRSAIQLEESLNTLKNAGIAGEKKAAALASGEDEHPDSELAELRTLHQESENLLKEALRAEAQARRARTRQRVAARVAERVKDLESQGRSKDEINAEEAAIRAAGEVEGIKLEAVLATESTARIHAARETAIAAERVLKERQEEAHDLRKSHEQAVAELAKEMAEKKRRGKDSVAAKLQERKAKRQAELKKAKANKDEVTRELAKLDLEATKEERRLEAEIDQEAAMLAQAEVQVLAKREAEARAAQLTADNSRRAGEVELERMRREHEEHQRTFEETQENKRQLRQRALAERLDRRRQEKINAAIAASESADAQQKLVASLEQEKVAAEAELEEELVKEACHELELQAQRQARAEQAVRTSAQTAIDDAEKRAKLAREEHERSTKELDKQLAAAKVSQGNKLRDRLAKKREDRESQLRRENADAETVKEAMEMMEAEEQKELARLRDHLAKERERLHAENLARATARRMREEAEARDKAAAAADAAELAKQEAVACLQRLQTQHAEQHAALEHQMEEEKRSREGKLRDRLAKKRKAKEHEMQEAALSEREKQEEQKRLEEEERAERQRFHDQIEAEKKKSVDAQRRNQDQALAAAAAEAARYAEMAAAASARAAAADAVREAVEGAEQDEFKRKAQKLKELSQANEERERAALAGSSATNKSKLMDRLAKKKAKAEAKKRELEAAHRREEEVLLLKHKEEVEAAKAAAAPGWTGDIAWDEAVTVAMAESPRDGETQSDREARVLKSVLEADIVPENKLGKCVELVMAGRHDKETAELLTTQYKERASRLATSLGKLLVDKNSARTEAVQRLAKMNATDDEKAEATADVDDEFARRQQQMEAAIIQEMEPVHLEQQLELRQRQLHEVAGTFRSIAPESALKRLQEINASRHTEELANLHAAMEREKEERFKRLQEERTKFEEQLRQRHDKEMQRLQAEEDKVMDAEREAQEARLKEKQAELERQRDEEKRKMEKRSDKLNADQKEALLEKFKLDQAAELSALRAEEQSSKSKLEQKLAARRQKKTEELRKREERQLKEKETRDAQRLQEIEKQTELEEAAEAGVLSASGSVSGLRVDIDQAAIQLARQVGGPNEAKERLKETLAANESRKMVQRHNSISGRGSVSGVGGGASAAAAAAAATAATATAYTHISAKLEGIEGLIAALKAAQGNNLLAGRNNAASGGGTTQVYRDAEDAATIPEGRDLQIIPTEKLPVQALARLEFGEHLLSVLGLADTVKLKIAKNLPPSEGPAGDGVAGGPNANAFRNSYMWEAASGILHVHVRRLSSSGDFGLVLVHAAAHLQVDPSDMSNDLDPRFTQHFHRSLKVLTQELFKTREAAAPAADAGVGSPSTRPGGSVSGTTNVMATLSARGTSESKKTGPARRVGSEEFAQDRIAERMEKYARASGHPRLMELLSRHANDQKDKFTLSDDEDQASNVGDDADYMEHFDNRDADSIFRSPIGSFNGRKNSDDAASDEEKEEKTRK